MSNITTQAFREAADQCEGLDEEPIQQLLLAAAEQCEQLDHLHLDEMTRVLDAAGIPKEYRLYQRVTLACEQIATLTEQLDEMKQLFLDENVKVAALTQQLHILKAELENK